MKKTSFYIHFPFCIKKCNYCDFVSFACGGNAQDLTDFYVKEIELWYEKFGRKKISSIYFGGGTPSLLPPENVERILEKICALYDVDCDAEITMEANPKTIDEKKLYDFSTVGVSRLSLGIQSFDDEELGFLGRVYNGYDAEKSFEIARKFFSNLSCDFIYAMPFQTVEKWAKNLERIAMLDVEHLSLYELIIEPKTVFYSMVRDGKISPVSDVVAKRMYDLTNRVLKGKFFQYEISNYSKKNFESRHNLNYWNGGDYIGVGVSASGRIFDGKRHFISDNPRTVDQWKSNVLEGVLPVKILSKKKRAEEMLIMGLRKNCGINFDEFRENCGVDFFDVIDEKKFQNMLSEKRIVCGKNFVRISSKSRAVLDAVIREIIK